SPVARARDEHRTAAGAQRRLGGSCPLEVVRAAPEKPLGTSPGGGAPLPLLRLAFEQCRGTSGSGRGAPAGAARACPTPRGLRSMHTTRSPPASSCVHGRAGRIGRT